MSKEIKLIRKGKGTPRCWFGLKKHRELKHLLIERGVEDREGQPESRGAGYGSKFFRA